MPRHLFRRVRIYPRSLAGWLIGASIITTIASLLLVALALSELKKSEWARALQANATVVSVLAAGIARDIELYDLSLRTIVDDLAVLEIKQMDPETRHAILFESTQKMHQLGGILVINESGQTIANSHDLRPRFNDYSHREYFRAPRDNPDVGLFISRPFITNSGKYVIALSRRLSRHDGSFAGIVVGIIQLSYFQEIF